MYVLPTVLAATSSAYNYLFHTSNPRDHFVYFNAQMRAKTRTFIAGNMCEEIGYFRSK